MSTNIADDGSESEEMSRLINIQRECDTNEASSRSNKDEDCFARCGRASGLTPGILAFVVIVAIGVVVGAVYLQSPLAKKVGVSADQFWLESNFTIDLKRASFDGVVRIDQLVIKKLLSNDIWAEVKLKYDNVHSTGGDNEV